MALLVISWACVCVALNVQSPVRSSAVRSSTSLRAFGGFFGKKDSKTGASPVSPMGKVEEVDSVVVGSGISGSTAAYYMDKGGLDIVLTEVRVSTYQWGSPSTGLDIISVLISGNPRRV